MYRGFLLAGCLVLLLCTQSIAGEVMNGVVASVEPAAKALALSGPDGGDHKEQLRTWLKTIKPAAGDYRAPARSLNYWETRVNRKRRVANHQ